MSDDEMMQWIHENWRVYAYRHIVGLLMQTLSSSGTTAALLAAGVGGGGRRFKEALSVVDSLYEIIETATSPSIIASSSSSFAVFPRRGSMLSREPSGHASNAVPGSSPSTNGQQAVHPAPAATPANNKLSQLFNKR